MASDSACVYRARDIGEADIVVAWLAEREIEAFVKNRHAVATLHITMIVAPRGIEVCVMDAGAADEAKALLDRHAEEIAGRRQAMTSTEPIQVSCEDCGGTSTFPGRQGGTVQTCPHCRAHVDVPTA